MGGPEALKGQRLSFPAGSFWGVAAVVVGWEASIHLWQTPPWTNFASSKAGSGLNALARMLRQVVFSVSDALASGAGGRDRRAGT